MEEKLKVLIVDDNVEFVKLLAMFINSQKDMEVVGTLNDGNSVVAKVKELKPDVMLLDIIMPEKDGVAVFEDLEEQALEKRPHIVIMSAIGQEKITGKAMALGASYYVIKPFDLDTLVGRIRELSVANNTFYESKGTKYVSTKSMMVNPNTNIRDYGIPQQFNVKRKQLYRDYYELSYVAYEDREWEYYLNPLKTFNFGSTINVNDNLTAIMKIT